MAHAKFNIWYCMGQATPHGSALFRTPGPASRVLVLGASGRLGRVCRAAWEGSNGLVWQLRRACPNGATSGRLCLWPPLGAPVSALDVQSVDVVLCLAGVVRGPKLARNTALALAAVDAGRALGARAVLVASSGAVYGPSAGAACETTPPRPASAYGRAKLEMERALQACMTGPDGGAPRITSLRIANVAGSDALLGGSVAERAARPVADRMPVVLDRFADGEGPARSYIGPLTLARVLAQLVDAAAAGVALPPVLNVAQPGLVRMSALLDAAEIARDWRPAPAGAVPTLALDVTRLGVLPGVRVPPADAAAIIREWRLSGA